MTINKVLWMGSCCALGMCFISVIIICPLHSPGKNTEVGSRFLLQSMKVKSESEVAQLCLTSVVSDSL